MKSIHSEPYKISLDPYIDFLEMEGFKLTDKKCFSEFIITKDLCYSVFAGFNMSSSIYVFIGINGICVQLNNDFTDKHISNKSFFYTYDFEKTYDEVVNYIYSIRTSKDKIVVVGQS